MFTASLFIIAESGSKLSVHQQMDKQYVVYIFTGVLSALKRKKILHMKTMLSEIMQPLKKKKEKPVIPLIWVQSNRKRTRKENGGCQTLGEWENGKLFSECSVLFLQGRKVLEIGCTTWIYLTILNYIHLKLVRKVNFVMRILPQFF